MQETRSRKAGDPEIIGDGELREDAFDLQGALDAEPADLVRLAAGDVATAEEHAAAVRDQQARYQIEERGLAGAVRPDDCVRPAAGKLEGQLIDGGQPAEPLAELFGAQNGIAHGSVRNAVSIDAGALRSASRASQSCHNPITPLGANITTRIATAPTINE